MNIVLKTFSFKNIILRSIIFDENYEEPWFLGNDVARALEYANIHKAVLAHTSESDRKRLIYKASPILGEANVRSELWSKNDYSDKVLINESGLYCMIFGSKLESAEAFKSWVAGDVLPSIRKDGGYIFDQELLPEKDQAKVKKDVEKLAAQVQTLKAKNAKLQARRHELLAESRELKVQNRKFKKEVKALNECADIWENMFDNISKELDLYRSRLNAYHRAKNPVPVAQPASAGSTYKVDKEGFRIII